MNPADHTFLTVSNEFASIEVRVEPGSNGNRLLLTDRRSSVSRPIDLLTLEGLIWAPEWVMASLADPGLGEFVDDGRRGFTPIAAPLGERSPEREL